MSELIDTAARPNGKHHLLTGVCAVALLGILPQSAAAEDDRPTVWIEVGTQLERLTDGEERFAPPFVSTMLENPFTSPRTIEAPPRYSFGQEGSITFAPDGSD